METARIPLHMVVRAMLAIRTKAEFCIRKDEDTSKGVLEFELTKCTL